LSTCPCCIVFSLLQGSVSHLVAPFPTIYLTRGHGSRCLTYKEPARSSPPPQEQVPSCPPLFTPVFPPPRPPFFRKGPVGTLLFSPIVSLASSSFSWQSSCLASGVVVSFPRLLPTHAFRNPFCHLTPYPPLILYPFAFLSPPSSLSQSSSPPLFVPCPTRLCPRWFSCTLLHPHPPHSPPLLLLPHPPI